MRDYQYWTDYGFVTKFPIARGVEDAKRICDQCAHRGEVLATELFREPSRRTFKYDDLINFYVEGNSNAIIRMHNVMWSQQVRIEKLQEELKKRKIKSYLLPLGLIIVMLCVMMLF